MAHFLKIELLGTLVISKNNEHVRILAKEVFNNYVDQILPNFDPPPPRVDKNGHFTYYLPFTT